MNCSPLRLILLAWSLSGLAAMADRQAVPITLLNSATGECTVGSTSSDPTNGLIKEAELRIKDPAADDHRLDGKIVHTITTANQDLLIPLGRFGEGSATIDYLVSWNNCFWSGQMVVVQGWSLDDINASNYRGPVVVRHEGLLPMNRVRLRAYKEPGSSFHSLWYLQFDYEFNAGTQNQIAVTISGNLQIDESYGNQNHALSSKVVQELSQFNYMGGLPSARFSFNKPVDVQGYPVLTTNTPPTTAAWSNAFLRRGSVTSSALEFGTDADAVGENSIAVGTTAKAVGNNAFALGEGTIASLNAVALGLNSKAGQQSFAVHGGDASGFRAFATMGGIASGLFSTAIGSSAAAGHSSMTLGLSNTASASNSYILGRSNQVVAGADSSIAVGLSNTLMAPYSQALAIGGKTTFGYEHVLGMFNRIEDSANPAWQGYLSPILRVGNGTSDVHRRDALTMRKNGQTNLRNFYWNPSVPLAVATGSESSGGEALVVEGHTRLRGRVIIEKPQGDISMGIYE